MIALEKLLLLRYVRLQDFATSWLLPAESDPEIATPLTVILFWSRKDGLFRVYYDLTRSGRRG